MAEGRAGSGVEDDWDRLQRHYHEAMALTPPERAGYLERCSGDDPRLRDRLARMLDASPGDTFIRAAVEVAGAPDARPVLRPGDRVGVYRVERELGSGGMGVAYLASRDDAQFVQHVALKVMRVGARDEHLLARFRAERQILAALEHPNIARLVDGGETADGRPYFAMEFVEGERLTDHCSRLPIDARLALFQKVCAAVRHAHVNLIVHRDIKPSNVLVTPDGEPKLLDFGIAKILLPAHSMVETQTGYVPFTPRYASPEQMMGRPATTACDVYSLGIVLYELLAATVPFPESNLAELSQALALREAPTPGIDPDLDAIVLKAIRRDPQDRYASVDDLSRDIDRYRLGFPVDARRRTWRYRAMKFVARNRAASVMAAALAVAIVASGAGAVVLTRQAQEQRDTAEQVANFLSNVFQAPDPANARGRELTARDILDYASASIDAELAGRPKAQGLLLDMLGRTYRNMGDDVTARPLFERSLAVRRAAFGPASAETAEALQSLGNLLWRTGEYAAAEKTLRECLAIQIEAIGEQNHTVGTTKNLLGLSLLDQARYDEAETLFSSALETYGRLDGERDIDYGLALNNLAITRRRKGDFLGAERDMRRYLAVSRAAFGDDHPNVGLAQSNLASLLVQLERYAEAEPLAREGLALRRRLYPAGHIDVANALIAQSMVQQRLGRLDDAEALWAETFQLLARLASETHGVVRAARHEHVHFLRARGRHTEALADAEALVALDRKDQASDSPGLAGDLRVLGLALTGAGRPAAAEAALREALAIYEKRHGAANPVTTARTLIALGQALHAQGRTADARPFLERAHGARAAVLPPDDPLVIAARMARDGVH